MRNTHSVMNHRYGTVCHQGDLNSCEQYVANATYLFNAGPFTIVEGAAGIKAWKAENSDKE